jgi:hypothetical protein
MAINPGYAQSMLGQWVEAHSAHGVHTGILHQVRPDGIVLAIPRSGVSRMASSREIELRVEHAIGGANTGVEQIQFFRPFFNPFFFFIPFFLLFALRRRIFI